MQITGYAEFFEEMLPCDLSSAELLSKSRNNCKLRGKIHRKKEKAKAKQAKLKADIQRLESLIETNYLAIETGTEDRQVKCERRPNYQSGQMISKRLDTFEIIDVRPLREAEKQQALEFTEAIILPGADPAPIEELKEAAAQPEPQVEELAEVAIEEVELAQVPPQDYFDFRDQAEDMSIEQLRTRIVFTPKIGNLNIHQQMALRDEYNRRMGCPPTPSGVYVDYEVKDARIERWENGEHHAHVGALLTPAGYISWFDYRLKGIISGSSQRTSRQLFESEKEALEVAMFNLKKSANTKKEVEKVKDGAKVKVIQKLTAWTNTILDLPVKRVPSTASKPMRISAAGD